MDNFTREYYSLAEASSMISGEHSLTSASEKISWDFVHDAANGKIRLILPTLNMQAIRYGKNGSRIGIESISHRYAFVDQHTAALYETDKETLQISYRNAEDAKLYAPDESGYWLIDSDNYFEISSRNLCIFTKDIKAYLAQKGLTENISIKEFPKDLKTLILAYEKLWANADPKEKDTWRKNDDVETWLKSQGYGNNPAKVGASIIRPDYAKGIK